MAYPTENVDFMSMISKLQADLDAKTASIAELQGKVDSLQKKAIDSTSTSVDNDDDKLSEGGIRLELDDSPHLYHADYASKELEDTRPIKDIPNHVSHSIPFAPPATRTGKISHRLIPAAANNIEDDDDDDTPVVNPWSASLARPREFLESEVPKDAMFMHQTADKPPASNPESYWQIQNPIHYLPDEESFEEGEIVPKIFTTKIMINGVPRSIPSSLKNSAASRKHSAMSSTKYFPPLGPPSTQRHGDSGFARPGPPHRESFGRKIRASAPAKLTRGWQANVSTKGPSLGPSRQPPPFERYTPRTTPCERRGYEAHGIRKLRLKECAICGETSHFAKVCPNKFQRDEMPEGPVVASDAGGSPPQSAHSRSSHETRPNMSRINEKAPGYPIDRQFELIDTMMRRLGVMDEEQ